MSKTFEEVGLIVGGLALALAAGPVGILALQGNVAVFQAMVGIGVSSALAGVGVALRPTPRGVGTGNSISFQSGDVARRVIYGQEQTAGVLTYASFPPSQNLSADNQYVHLIYTLCGHEISSFDAVSVNGSVYNFGTGSTTYGDIVLSSGPSYYWVVAPSTTFLEFYWQHMFFEFDFGRPLNTSQPFPQLAAADSTWTSACLQRGCAKVHVWLRYDAGDPAIFPSGQIPNIQFLVTGKKLIDPRVISTWQASTAYVQNQWALDSAGHLWVQTNASGVSGAGPTSPLIASSFPATVSDGTCSWTSYGYGQTQISDCLDNNPQGHMVNQRLINDAWVAGDGPYPTDYVIEAPLGYLQMATASSGASGTIEPTFSTTRGGVTTDGGTTWTCLGRSWHAINPSNSALVVNDYLQDTDAGLSVPLATIDASATIAAANICEDQELIIWNADGTKVYENLYSCNGMFDHSSNRGDVLSGLCKSMAGWCVPPGDLWRIYAGSYVTPTVALTDADMRDTIKADFRHSRREVANTIGGNYTPNYLPSNPPAGLSLNQVPPIWSSQKYPEFQANGLIWSGGSATSSPSKPNQLNTEDGGQVIRQQEDFEFVTSVWQAQRLAKITLMRLRFQQTLTLPCKLTALQLEAGDTFSFTHLRWLILDQTFEVTQWSLIMDMRGSGGGASNNSGAQDSPALGVDIVAQQTDPSVYQFLAPSSATDFGEYSPYGVTGVMTGVE
jgi:hypothetical protein